jgi:hypothetical protein
MWCTSKADFGGQSLDESATADVEIMPEHGAMIRAVDEQTAALEVAR